jgi:hypothetical protein
MTSKMEFTADEWAVVAEAPLHAAAHVIAADQGGTVRENLAIRRVYAAAREMRGESALLDDLAASPPSLDLDQMLGREDVIDPSHARLRTALTIVSSKAVADDVDAYRGFVLAVVQTVAEANREGGFAGIGGEEVSAEEQTALDELVALLER